MAKVGTAMPDLEPSAEHPLGTDTVGRDILAVMVVGTPSTLRIGLVAGAIGLGLGILLGFLAGYFGGWVDTLIKGAADVLLTVPGLFFLVVIATTIKRRGQRQHDGACGGLVGLDVAYAHDPQPSTDAA